MVAQVHGELAKPSMSGLARLAIPAAISVILNNAFRVVDQYSVQWIGADAQAAVGSSTFVLILLYSIWAISAYGVGPLVARATGAGDKDLRSRVIAAGLGNALALGLLSWGATYLLAPTIAQLVGLSGEPERLLIDYLQALALAGLPLALGPCVDQALIAMGRTRLIMLLQGASTLGNLALNALFILELDWGIAGAAWASGISRGLALIVGLGWLLFLTRPAWRGAFERSMIFRLCKIGLPIGANSAAYALVYWALLRVAISPLGPEVNAALGIGFSALEGFTWPLFHGISLGVATLVGQQLGAGRPDEAQRAARLGFWPVTFAGLLAAGAFGFLARPLCGFFTGPGPVLEQAVIYAQVLAFSQVMVAWESLAEGVLQGSGDTRTVFRWSFPLNALRVPLCWALAGPLGLGAAGVWWGINLTTWVKAAGKGRAALRGDWTRVQI